MSSDGRHEGQNRSNSNRPAIGRGLSGFSVCHGRQRRFQVTVMNMDPVMHDIQTYETSQLGPCCLTLPAAMKSHHKRFVTAENRAASGPKEAIHMTKGAAFL